MNRKNSYIGRRQAAAAFLGLVLLMFSGVPRIFAEEAEKQEVHREDNTAEENRKEKEEKENNKQEEETGLQVSQILCEEPDGQNGWYLTAPETVIVHTEAKAVTKYKMTASDGTVVEGELKLEEKGLSDSEEYDLQKGTANNEKNCGAAEQEKEQDQGAKPDASDSVTGHIPAEAFTEGTNTVEIWMISQETDQEVFRARREIPLDLCPPQEPKIRFPSGLDGSGRFFNSMVNAEVNCAEDVSGVESVFVLLDGKEKQRITGGSGTIVISPGYVGKISAYAVDGAGRKSSTRMYGSVVCEDESPRIEIKTTAAADRWQPGGVDLVIYMEDSGGKYTFSSGLGTAVCRVGGKTAVSKNWGDDEKNSGPQTLQIQVTEASRGGNPVPVTVIVTDRAGNTSVLTESFYIDREQPVVQISGVRDGLTAGGSCKAVFTASDENILESCRIKIQRTGMDNKTETIEKTREDGWKGTSQKRQTEMEFSEDGKYVCTVSASDAAGHSTEKTISFVIDKTDPVIRYVEQLDGAYLPFFQWNYGKEMIRDLTENSFTMYLNGRKYIPRTKITEEGTKLLEVRARDQAGNEAFAEAVFQIDHTPPDIFWGGVKDGGVCNEGTLMSVWVEGAKERIKSIVINGERQKTGYDSQIFQLKIPGRGKYTVFVRAEDAAGNYTEESISFEAEGDKEHGILPAIFGTKGTNSGENGAGQEDAGTNKVFVLTIPAAGGAVCAGVWIMRKRRNRKMSGTSFRE